MFRSFDHRGYRKHSQALCLCVLLLRNAAVIVSQLKAMAYLDSCGCRDDVGNLLQAALRIEATVAKGT